MERSWTKTFFWGFLVGDAHWKRVINVRGVSVLGEEKQGSGFSEWGITQYYFSWRLDKNGWVKRPGRERETG